MGFWIKVQLTLILIEKAYMCMHLPSPYQREIWFYLHVIKLWFSTISRTRSFMSFHFAKGPIKYISNEMYEIIPKDDFWVCTCVWSSMTLCWVSLRSAAVSASRNLTDMSSSVTCWSVGLEFDPFCFPVSFSRCFYGFFKRDGRMDGGKEKR